MKFTTIMLNKLNNLKLKLNRDTFNLQEKIRDRIVNSNYNLYKNTMNFYINLILDTVSLKSSQRDSTMNSKSKSK